MVEIGEKVFKMYLCSGAIESCSGKCQTSQLFAKVIPAEPRITGSWERHRVLPAVPDTSWLCSCSPWSSGDAGRGTDRGVLGWGLALARGGEGNDLDLEIHSEEAWK